MECKKCSFCCTHLAMWFENNKSNTDWIRARGFKVTQKNDKVIEVMVKHTCDQLIHGKCRIHNNKPEACINYPKQVAAVKNMGLDPLITIGENCGYKEMFK